MSLNLINRQLLSNKSLHLAYTKRSFVPLVNKLNLSTLTNSNNVNLNYNTPLSQALAFNKGQDLQKLQSILGSSLSGQISRNFSVSSIVKTNTTPSNPASTQKTENNNNQNKEEPKKKQTLKDLMKQYGLSAFIVWMLVAGVDIVFCFIVLYLAGEDQVKYFENLGKELYEYFGFKVDNSKPSILFGDGKETKPTLLSTFIVAYSLHHLTVPYRLPITIALTPMVARRLAKVSWLSKYIAPKK
ncbi:hypothetical protein CONCODRAFT_72851 [Conidiobolus coronatus NRRL 28638]|uniref:DUF1279 domain-containing protein n=1 Tax=Conidiobolus coronatus (strain ATCC 28846 / CBS 209.66 / NRRL 28638) TaxID=796925 RepID=A0A137NXY2_CONC2|nr:hypothetical protein CONCODRAFT_72851 [Conidiobolus coronatus NRRL 28638]|eukprot:KXN67607.1 hypothetical protein CONCODRAFT_72851 [Conidiobolus coronatus NRRL 28638]